MKSMRVCTKCQKNKPEDEFYWYDKKRTRREYRCKECCKDAKKVHYKTSYENRQKQRERSALIRARNRAYLTQWLKEHPCVDCNNADIRVLQFDHIEPLRGTKKKRVTAMLGVNLQKLQEEIDKCEIRCANCHMIRTREQFGWLLT